MTDNSGKVIDMAAFRTKRSLTGERRMGVQDAFRARGPVGSASRIAGSEADLGTRLERIKASIGRINQLMSELRTMSDKSDEREQDMERE